MSIVQRDYILRLIEAVAAALARIIRRRDSGDLEGARREAQIATIEFLGPLASIVGSVDSRTASDLVGEGWRLSAWARLLAEDAETLRQMDQPEAAQRNDRRACELLLEVLLRGEVLETDAVATLEGLRQRVPVESLDPRYHEVYTRAARDR
jgi:hypothetical protein